MTEKRKWFDPKDKPIVLVSPILTASNVTRDDLEKFVPEILAIKLTDNTKKLLTTLAGMEPARRLKRNLKVLLDLLERQDDNLFNTRETEALANLMTAGGKLEHGELLQGLLNVYERYQAKRAFSNLFEHWRARRKWLLQA